MPPSLLHFNPPVLPHLHHGLKIRGHLTDPQEGRWIRSGLTPLLLPSIGSGFRRLPPLGAPEGPSSTPSPRSSSCPCLCDSPGPLSCCLLNPNSSVSSPPETFSYFQVSTFVNTPHDLAPRPPNACCHSLDSLPSVPHLCHPPTAQVSVPAQPLLEASSSLSPGLHTQHPTPPQPFIAQLSEGPFSIPLLSVIPQLWKVPADNQGNPLTPYQIYSKPAGVSPPKTVHHPLGCLPSEPNPRGPA